MKALASAKVPLARGLYLVPGFNRSRFPYGNCLLVSGGGCALIDSGAGPSLRDVAPEVEQIIHTHFHIDHVWGDELYPNAEVFIHALDAPPLVSEEGFLRYTGLGDLLRDHPEQRREAAARRFLHQGIDGNRVRRFEHGQVFDFGNVKISALHAPGHSPGHVIFIEERLGFGYLGDIDLGAFGPWYGHPVCDLDAYEDSVNKVEELGLAMVATGHQDVMTGASEIRKALKAFVGRIRRREEKILRMLDEPRTLEEIVDRWPIYGRELRPSLFFRHFERQMIMKHLDRLLRRGEVQLVDGGRYWRHVGRVHS